MMASSSRVEIKPPDIAGICDWLDAPLLVLDPELRCLHATPAACALLGAAASRLEGRPAPSVLQLPEVSGIVHVHGAVPEDAATLNKEAPEAWIGDPPERRRITLRWRAWNGGSEQETPLMLVHLADTGPRAAAAHSAARARQAPSVGESRSDALEAFHRFFGSMLDACFLLDLGGRVMLANHAAAALVGYGLVELQSVHFLRMLCASPEAFRELLVRLERGESAPGAAIELKLGNGSRAMCHCSVRNYRDRLGRVVAVEVVLQLASGSAARRLEPLEYRIFLERRVLERTSELSRSNKLLQDKIVALETARKELSEYRTRLRELAFELTLVEQQERRRLALELHDGVVQDLAMARMRLSSLKNRMPCDDRRELCDELLELVKKMIRESRGLIWEMGSPELYELGFGSAIEELAEEFQDRHGLDMACLLRVPAALQLHQDRKVMLFQMVRELLTNVVKHAGAQCVVIESWLQDQDLLLRVSDDGQGFSQEAALPPRRRRDSGFGLFSIRERLNLIGGSLEISSDEHGASCVLRMPLQHETRQSAGTALERREPKGRT